MARGRWNLNGCIIISSLRPSFLSEPGFIGLKGLHEVWSSGAWAKFEAKLKPEVMKSNMGRWVSRVVMLVPALVSGVVARAQIPIIDIINAAAKKVVVAIDLKVQALQTQTINLQVAEKELENTMEDSELGDIIGWVKGEEQLYAEYYQELWQVKAVISGYKRVADMIDEEAQIVRQYQRMTSALKADKHLTVEEVEALGASLASIVRECANNIQQIRLVIQTFVTQMPDAGRLRIIDEAGALVDRNYAAMGGLYQGAVLLSLSRAKDANDVKAVKGLWGVE